MKFHFIHNGYGWWLKLKTEEEVFAYLEEAVSRRKQATIADFERIESGKHPNTELSGAVTILQKHIFPDLEKTEIMDYLFLDMKNTMLKAVSEGKEVYINSCGGYFYRENGKREPVKTFLDKEGAVFPAFKKEDIRIKSWPGGEHFYAYIGDYPIRDGDVLKWDTMEEALQVAEKYLSKNGEKF